MIGRTATSRCRICRTIGILPVFLLGCVVAWMAAAATGWIWGILAFVITLVCGVMSLRAGCQLAFPELPSAKSPEYADPELFAPSPNQIPLEEISPGHVESLAAETPSVLTQDPLDSEDEEVSDSDNIFDDQHQTAVESETDLFHRELEALASEEVAPTVAPTEETVEATDEDEFSREVERMMNNHELDVPQEAQTDQTDTQDADEDLPFAPQPKSERPSMLSDDPGRRLAQSLVMVGASPSHQRVSTSAKSVTLRPTSLNSARSTGPDDLKLIRGVGSSLEDMLHSLGYFHFDQIAAWTPEEVRWVDENLDGFKGRVSRDHWVAQAIVLAQSHRRSEGVAAMTPNLRPTGTPDSNTQ